MSEEKAEKAAEQSEVSARKGRDYHADNKEMQAKLTKMHVLANLFHRLPVSNLGEVAKGMDPKAGVVSEHGNDEPSAAEMKLLREELQACEHRKDGYEQLPPDHLEAGSYEFKPEKGAKVVDTNAKAYTNIRIHCEYTDLSFRALCYVAELERYVRLLKMHGDKAMLSAAFADAREEIVASTEHIGIGRNRIHKGKRSAHWHPQCWRRRNDNKAYMVLDGFVEEIFKIELTDPSLDGRDMDSRDSGQETYSDNASQDIGSDKEKLAHLRACIADLPSDLILLLADSVREIYDAPFTKDPEDKGLCGCKKKKKRQRYEIDRGHGVDQGDVTGVKAKLIEKFLSDKDQGHSGNIDPRTQSVFHVSFGAAVIESITAKWEKVVQVGFDVRVHGLHVWTKFLRTDVEEFVRSVPRKRNRTGAHVEYSSAERNELVHRFRNAKIDTIDDVIKKDGIGRLLNTWASDKDDYRDWLKKLHKVQGGLEDVTMRVYRFRHWHMPQRELDARETSKLVTNMLYRQTLVWAGMPFCPWLPTIAVVLELGIFTSLYFAMMGGAYQTPNEPWSAGQTTNAFIENYVSTIRP